MKRSFLTTKRMMRSLLENVGEIYTNTLFLSDLFEFLALEPRVIDPIRSFPMPSTFMYADVIHVMVNGRIIESGGHHELLVHDGYYARSWKSQISEQHQTAGC